MAFANRTYENVIQGAFDYYNTMDDYQKNYMKIYGSAQMEKFTEWKLELENMGIEFKDSSVEEEEKKTSLDDILESFNTKMNAILDKLNLMSENIEANKDTGKSDADTAGKTDEVTGDQTGNVNGNNTGKTDEVTGGQTDGDNTDKTDETTGNKTEENNTDKTDETSGGDNVDKTGETTGGQTSEDTTDKTEENNEDQSDGAGTE